MATEERDVSTLQERFLRQVVVHHHAGDYYPDPLTVGRELRFTPAQIASVLRTLRATGWIAASPYHPERIRLTSRCWDALRRSPAPAPISAQNAA
jgi:hypothetical protein